MARLDELRTALTGGDEARAEAAAVQLSLAGVGALPLLAKLLESRDPDSRWWALRTLAQIPETPIAWLVRSLEDESPEVRQASALALTSHPDPFAIPALIRTLSEKEEVTAGLAAGALVAIGGPCVPALIDAYSNAMLSARIQIVRALTGIGDPRAIPTLLNASEENSAILNYWAGEGLDRLGLNMVYIKPG